MAEAFLLGIGGGGPSTVLSAVTLSSNGTYYPSQFSVDGFNEVIVSVTGDADPTDDVLYFNKVLKAYSNSSISTINARMFYGFSVLNTVDCPNVTTVSANAFYQCFNLQTLHLPNVTSAESGIFNYCKILRSVTMPQSIINSLQFQNTGIISYPYSGISSINQQSLNGTFISVIDDSYLTSIGSSAFGGCYNLSSIKFYNLTSMGTSTTLNCDNLCYIDFGNFSGNAITGQSTNGHILELLAASNCYISFYWQGGTNPLKNIVTIDAPYAGIYGYLTQATALISLNCNRIYSSSYYSYFSKLRYLCTNESQIVCSITSKLCLSYIKLTVASQILSSMSTNMCLKTVILLSSSVCTIPAGCFTATPITTSSYLGYYGSIYVPSSLVEDYKVATNWAVYSNRITAYIGD